MDKEAETQYHYIGVLSHTFYCNFCRDIEYSLLHQGYCYVEDCYIGVPLNYSKKRLKPTTACVIVRRKKHMWKRYRTNKSSLYWCHVCFYSNFCACAALHQHEHVQKTVFSHLNWTNIDQVMTLCASCHSWVLMNKPQMLLDSKLGRRVD